MIKKEKGISLITLTITITVLMILTNIIIYNVKDSLKLGNLKEMQNDIENLRDKVASFYAQNGKIPAKIKYQNTEHLRNAGLISTAVDTGEFYVIDLSVLENLTLHRGKDFEKVKNLDQLTDEEAKSNTDLYIINEASHNIFYVAGITLDNETFYTDYRAEDVDKVAPDLRYVDNVKIPVGFYYAGGRIDTGIVISDVQGDDLDNSKHGNQFVWVPVPNIDDFHTIKSYSNNSLEEIKGVYFEPSQKGYQYGTEEAEYNAMKKSVEDNKGFYIGRYEAGNDGNNNVIVQKGANVYRNIKWGTSMTNIAGGAVEKAKNFTVGKTYEGKVTSTLIYGVQWDATMQFMDSNYITGNCAEDSYVRNSMGKGWYGQNYNQTTTGNIETNPNQETGKDLIYSDNPNVIANQQKNIYDMAGNVFEWTMEAYGTNYRVRRGGRYGTEGSGYPASCRGNTYTPDTSYDTIGFRVALYLNEEEKWSAIYDEKGLYKDKNGDTAYIPEGFQVSETPSESTIDGGLVIRDSEKNEFVWVPVLDIDDFHTIKSYSNNSLQDIAGVYFEPSQKGYQYGTEEAEYNAMKKSVEDNGGFYIGRYEAGKDTNGNVIVQKGATVYNWIPWGTSMTNIAGGAVEKAKSFTTGKTYEGKVTSTLIYGVQWDATLQFMDSKYITGTCAEDSYVRNSEGKGWYSDNYNVTTKGNTETNPNQETGKDLIYSNHSNVIANQQKNIYDMAGNVFEWTMEAYSTNLRVFRAGEYRSDGTKYPASGRSSSNQRQSRQQ